MNAMWIFALVMSWPILGMATYIFAASLVDETLDGRHLVSAILLGWALPIATVAGAVGIAVRESVQRKGNAAGERHSHEQITATEAVAVELTTRGTPRQRAPKGTFDRAKWQREYQARRRAAKKAVGKNGER